MIKVKKEPNKFDHFPLEHCFFCDEPTQFWANEGETPVCRECGETHNTKEFDTMRITYQLQGRCFWHSDCVEGRRNGIMKIIRHEEDQNLLECLHCGAKGYYPVGKVCEIEVVEQTQLTAA